jgi:Ca2+-binding RTX toxin-like protein
MASNTIFERQTYDDSDAFDFAKDGDDCTVVSGGYIRSALGDAVASIHNSNTLINDGSISGYNYGVLLKGNNCTIVNNANESIAGDSAILFDGTNERITNYGALTGFISYGVTLGPDSDAILNNFGTIYGRSAAIHTKSSAQGGSINNSGLISSDNDGIYVSTSIGAITYINNALGGVIRGTKTSITDFDNGNDGAISVGNHGTLRGAVVGAEAADHIVNTGHVYGAVQLAGGNDVFNGKGGTSGAVFGGDGNDRIIGGKSNDHLSGGPGNDTLTGGPGKDHFVFDATLNPMANVDGITDFQHGVDRIDLSHSIFAALNPPGTLHFGMFHEGPAAHAANDRIIYTPANGWLTYDSNGNAAGGATHFATLAAHLTLTNTDFLVVA